MSPPAPQVAPLESPELRFLMAFWDVWQTLGGRLDAALRAGHGLDLRAFIVLSYLQEAQTPAALAQTLNLPRYEISRALAPLQARGLLWRQPSGADARSVTVGATAAGQTLWLQALQTVQAQTGPVLGGLAPVASGPHSLTDQLVTLAQTAHQGAQA